MLPNTAPIKPKKRSAIISSLLLTLCIPAQADVKSLLVTDPIIQKLKLFNNINASSFSRADATVLLDRLLIFTAPDFDKDMGDYLNPFGDVNSKSDYYTALMQLAYYLGSDTETVVTRENNLFRPLDYVTRQEFLKMAMQGFNIPIKNTNNLAGFTDKKNIAPWAVKYFSTAVAQGIIVGDATGQLNPDKNLTTYEALLILDRIVAKYDKAYLHNGTGFVVPTAVNLDKVLANTIGVEREPDKYVATAKPIDITDIVVEQPATGRCGIGAVVLRTVNTLDQQATPYYWWTVSNGYLGQYQDAAGETAGESLQKVCFYPATTAVTDYRVTANGGDNLGFTDSYQETLPANTFAVSNTPHNTTAMTLSVTQAPTSLTAGQFAVLDLTGSQIKEGELNVALEQVDIAFTVGTQTIPLFTGSPNNGDKIVFSVPVQENLYGRTGTLTVTAHTQDAQKSKILQDIRYLPKYAIKGQVMNNGVGQAASSVRIGTSTVKLDENNEFYDELVGDLNNQTITINVLGGDTHNSFANYPVTLSYQSPTAYVVMVGENTVSDGDSDDDGIPDEWETQYGLNINDAADAALDLDKDGFTNLNEFNGGSNPTDATSKPLVIKVTAGDKQITLQWKAITGATNYGVCYATETITDINNCLNYAGGAWRDTTATTIKISSLGNGTKYYFRVLVEDAVDTLRISNIITVTPNKAYTLNDTGITTCSDGASNNLPCPVVSYPSQDAQSGRDVTQNNDSDGHAGFNFTKISGTGVTLAANATGWNCVKDNVTGLIWEVKTDDDGLHDKDWDYSWYEPDSTKNGGYAGEQNGGFYGAFCGWTSACDTYAYVQAVNVAGWCGYNDWRMPSKAELSSIVDYSRYNPAIDVTYFPNTVSDLYWSSSLVSDGAGDVYFYNGYDGWIAKDNSLSIRLVRSGQ